VRSLAAGRLAWARRLTGGVALTLFALLGAPLVSRLVLAALVGLQAVVAGVAVLAAWRVSGQVHG
jgi:hypothetical protein